MRTHALLLGIARHLGSTPESGTAAAAGQRSAWVRRSLLILLAALTGIAGIAALWVAGLVALWDTPWRIVYLVASGVLLLAVAATALYGALAPRTLAPASEPEEDEDVFPRSAAMRVLIAGLPVLALLATRSRPVREFAAALGLRLR